MNSETEVSVPVMDARTLNESAPEAAPTLIDGLLRAGEVMMISGGPKSGKSRFALQLALSLASDYAADFLGHAVRTVGPVLYIDNSTREETLAERVREMAEAQSDTMRGLEKTFHISAQVNNPRTVDDLAELVPWLQRQWVRVVVIDSLSRALPIAATATQAQRTDALCKAYATLARYASVTGAAFICLHGAHEKGLEEAERLVDTHVRLKQHLDVKDALVMSISARSFAAQEPVVLRKTYPCFTLDAEGLDPHLTEGLSASQANVLRQAAADRAASPEAVVTALRSLGGASLKHALQECVQRQTGCSWRVAAELLAAAITSGLIACTNVTTQAGRRAIRCALPEEEILDVVPVERLDEEVA